MSATKVDLYTTDAEALALSLGLHALHTRDVVDCRAPSF